MRRRNTRHSLGSWGAMEGGFKGKKKTLEVNLKSLDKSTFDCRIDLTTFIARNLQVNACPCFHVYTKYSQFMSFCPRFIRFSPYFVKTELWIEKFISFWFFRSICFHAASCRNQNWFFALNLLLFHLIYVCQIKCKQRNCWAIERFA